MTRGPLSVSGVGKGGKGESHVSHDGRAVSSTASRGSTSPGRASDRAREGRLDRREAPWARGLPPGARWRHARAARGPRYAHRRAVAAKRRGRATPIGARSAPDRVRPRWGREQAWPSRHPRAVDEEPTVRRTRRWPPPRSLDREIDEALVGAAWQRSRAQLSRATARETSCPLGPEHGRCLRGSGDDRAARQAPGTPQPGRHRGRRSRESSSPGPRRCARTTCWDLPSRHPRLARPSRTSRRASVPRRAGATGGPLPRRGCSRRRCAGTRRARRSAPGSSSSVEPEGKPRRSGLVGSRRGRERRSRRSRLP